METVTAVIGAPNAPSPLPEKFRIGLAVGEPAIVSLTGKERACTLLFQIGESS